MAEPVYTLRGRRLPDGEPLSPLLLFHKWQGWDRFEDRRETDERGRTHDREAFKREQTTTLYLERVATAVQTANRECYPGWHERFARACDEVDAEKPLPATTQWRLVVGWATNPALEIGLTLDHLLGFPLIPGSAVKGMLHRVAEEELLAPPEGHAAIPQAPESPPATPPGELVDSLGRAAKVKALFGSLHLEPDQPDQPEGPRRRLAAWLAAVRGSWPRSEDLPEPWRQPVERLARLCDTTPAGGMVTCFDAVPAPRSFQSDRKALCVDVLTPHTGSSPNPLPFLAVRDGVEFELRYRLASWPTAAEPRDDAEGERADLLAGWNRELALEWLGFWAKRALSYLGAGGKTTAGYGYFWAELVAGASQLLDEPEPEPEPGRGSEPEPPAEPELSDDEREALKKLPDGIDENTATNYLNASLADDPEPLQAAKVRRFVALFPGKLEEWEKSPAPAKRRRVAAMRRLLAGGDGG